MMANGNAKLGRKAGIYMQWSAANPLLKAFVGVYDLLTCWQCFSADAPRKRGTTGSDR